MKESNKLSQFTNQYQVSKTLRFELKPQRETAEWIKAHDIIGVNDKNELIGKDAKRAEDYKYAKKLLDELHRLFIQEALSLDDSDIKIELEESINDLYDKKEKIESKDLPNKLFTQILDKQANKWLEEYQSEMLKYWQEDIDELEEKIANSADKKQIKGFNSAIKALEKKIKEPNKVLKKNNIGLLHSNEEAMRLLEWKIRSNKIQVTFKELEQGESNNFIPVNILKDYLRSFQRFYTYFSGFNDNRKNIYDVKDAKSTSLISRIFMNNMQFHFKNIEKWNKTLSSIDNSPALKDKKYDWNAELAKCEHELAFSANELFQPNSFINYFSQTGIDKYNEIIGGKSAIAGDPKIQGLNEVINLTRQQANAKRGQYPPMQELYKQILSKSDKTFIDAFEEDIELFEKIKSFHHDSTDSILEFAENAKGIINDIKNDKKNLFFAKDDLTTLSQGLFGNWNLINHQLSETIGIEKFDKAKLFSYKNIEDSLNVEIDNKNFLYEHLKDELKTLNFENIILEFFELKLKKLIKDINESWKSLTDNGVLDEKEIDKNRSNEGDKGFEQIAVIKQYLDNSNNLLHFIKDWTINIPCPNDANFVLNELMQKFTVDYPIIAIYNKTRNYIAKKQYSSDKIKINFENATLLDGWDRNKESDNYGVILEKNNLFYLAVMTPDSNKVFDYEISPKDSVKKKGEKEKMQSEIIAKNNEDSYKKINYKLLPGANKMLPKVFFAKSNSKIFNPSKEIINIKENKLYSKAEIEIHGIKNLHKYIDFCKKSLTKHPEWSKVFSFDFKDTEKYKSIDGFYRDVENQGYKISFDNIKESYIESKIQKGELYLFQIYNKDFSSYSKGKDNLHTSYWKLLFDKDNLQDTVLKLNGQAEIFFRLASVKWSKEKMEKGHHHEELKNKFSYPIIKDKRFTENKFFFHCPITLNFKGASIPGKFNTKVNTFLQNNSDVNIIGIDRGEKHLLYYSVIDQNGIIKEQGSLNTISNGFIPKGETKEREINYHSKLNQSEKDRDKARKSWSVIENIKELKAGYLSQVVHKLSQLIIKHNAIVVLEDLNIGFKRGRFGVEKQVYQKFEKALIDKLNYLVFKNEASRLDAGHYLNAYQLTNKFESFEKIGKQSGILFYTTASYTSTTDPITGFLKNVYRKYASVAKSIEFWKSFDSIIYNSNKNRFEFSYTVGKVASKQEGKTKGEDNVSKKQWTVCSSVMRSRYVKPKSTDKQKLDAKSEQIGNKGHHEIFNVNDELKELFKKNNIGLVEDMKSKLIEKEDASFHKSMIYYFNAIMTMRVSDSSKEKGTDENDFILSPVEPFFNSSKKYKNLPENGDANGAYNIARKGICILNKINDADDLSKKVDLVIKKEDWQNYAQSEIIVNEQINKLK